MSDIINAYFLFAFIKSDSDPPESFISLSNEEGTLIVLFYIIYLTTNSRFLTVKNNRYNLTDYNFKLTP